MDKIEELLTRGVANIIPSKEKLKDVLLSGKKLNVYLGIDPTATRIHLGNAVPLRKLQAFADLGHNVTFLIGDFTALIGDTSDKDSERPVLTSEQIEKNFQTYKKQAEKILDFSKIKVRYNSEWLKKLTFEEIVKLTQHFSFGDFASRELIRKRLTEEKYVGLHEALYPVMQGYDSYFMNTDVQVGGTDQTFNMQAGRNLQKDLRNKESFILANVFLLGTDGRKMSKTWNNAIWLEDNANDMYRKILSVNDDLIRDYFMLATNMTMDEIDKISSRLESDENPIDIKKVLANKIVEELHGKEEAQKAQKEFESAVQKKETPTEIPVFNLSNKDTSLIDVLVDSKLVSSRSEAKRIIEQKGVAIDGKVIENSDVVVYNGQIVQVGKHKFVKIRTAP